MVRHWPQMAGSGRVRSLQLGSPLLGAVDGIPLGLAEVPSSNLGSRI